VLYSLCATAQSWIEQVYLPDRDPYLTSSFSNLLDNLVTAMLLRAMDRACSETAVAGERRSERE